VAARKKAWEEGAWVREAAFAHANKRAARHTAAIAAE
jgi:ring-1,2-phenylacetyl-CoA epoxidase subunit PaaA